MESIKSNFIYQSAYQILTILFPMVTSPYLARVVGADGIGIYSFTYSIVFYFVIFGRLGLSTYGNREIAVARDDPKRRNQTFTDLTVVHLFFSVISIVAYIVYLLVFPGDYVNISWIQGLYLIGQMLDISWFFFGIEKFKITVVRNTAIKLLSLVAIFIFVKSPEDLWKYVFILAVGSVVSESAIWFALPRYASFVKPNIKNVIKYVAPLLMFFIPAIAVSLYKYMDKIMLGALSTTTQVGFYENSEKIINISLGLISSLGVVMMPRMSNMMAKGQTEDSLRMINTSMKFIMMLSSAMAFGIIGVSNVFPTVFFGDEFSPCNVLLCGLALSILFTAFANVLRTQYLIPRHYDKVYVISLLSGAVVNIIVNYLLIPHFHAMGAVFGTICAEAMVCIIQTAVVWKHIPVLFYIKQAVPYVVSGLVMAGAVYLLGLCLGQSILTLIIQVISGVVIYVALAFVYLKLTHDEILNILLNKIKRKK